MRWLKDMATTHSTKVGQGAAVAGAYRNATTVIPTARIQRPEMYQRAPGGSRKNSWKVFTGSALQLRVDLETRRPAETVPAGRRHGLPYSHFPAAPLARKSVASVASTITAFQTRAFMASPSPLTDLTPVTGASTCCRHHWPQSEKRGPPGTWRP